MHSFCVYESLSYLIMHIILMLLFCVYECLSYLIMHNIIIERAVTHSIIHIIIVHDFTVRPLLKRPDNTSISLSFSVFVKLRSYPKLLLAGWIVQYYLFDNINRPHTLYLFLKEKSRLIVALNDSMFEFVFDLNINVWY